ncbi:hypothetical protein EVAR_44973_1 [Eumeta japonica]|uniref:Uncharacterized protein n=1 Tax=Eumeta variegata TaxID=151549 RepID=A0A4C1W6I7_EUMVA|nr:hypothetical protein EVAR_44973_1 [Eumeta japonica]
MERRYSLQRYRSIKEIARDVTAISAPPRKPPPRNFLTVASENGFLWRVGKMMDSICSDLFIAARASQVGAGV